MAERSSRVGPTKSASSQRGSGPMRVDGDEMDEKNGKIAHQRTVPGRRILRNLGTNNDSPATGSCPPSLRPVSKRGSDSDLLYQQRSRLWSRLKFWRRTSNCDPPITRVSVCRIPTRGRSHSPAFKQIFHHPQQRVASIILRHVCVRARGLNFLEGLLRVVHGKNHNLRLWPIA